MAKRRFIWWRPLGVPLKGSIRLKKDSTVVKAFGGLGALGFRGFWV